MNIKSNNNGEEGKSLPKQYMPQRVESQWQSFWLEKNVYEVAYKFDKMDVKKPIFVIDTPPPFTSGELHIGHAYWNIINDTLARYKRMRGYNVLLPQGWDCQGLPTELKVQKKWRIPRENRELFREKCVEWTEQMISSMRKTMIRLGYRPDWEQFEYRTMDPAYWRNVQSTLLDFFEKDLVYRDAFPVHWCPNCETALAQAELGYVDQRGHLFYIKFPYNEDYIEIATTRPELLSACQALAVHPEDERYQSMIDGKAEVPLFKRKVPILADSQVDREFGTGIVMICTFGDEQDIRWQQKYDLPIIEAIDERGRLINSGKYSGLRLIEARKAIVSDLRDAELMSRQEEIAHKVLCHTERSDCMAPVEFLVKTQFFIKIRPFKEEVIGACKRMTWLPEYMLQRLIDWVNSIEWDWLISRQRIYGTPIPFWYCKECNEIIPAKRESLPIDPTKINPPVDKCPNCGSKNVKASEDVCDCWVDSSITPLIITGFFNHEKFYERAYPTTMREQGHDIIRTWLFYTTLRCLMLTDKQPFKEVLVNGHILGPDGYRMSKSRGNVISPEERLDEFGADSLRQALLSLTIGSDFPFKWEFVKYNKGFLQKYWSASRFAHQFIIDYNPSTEDAEHLSILDKWILAELVEMINTVTITLDKYQFHIATDAIQKFLWHDFCDQYLEAVKHRLYNMVNEEDYAAARYTLYTVLWNTTIVLAPICPHITEEIYQTLFKGESETVHAIEWPMTVGIPYDEEAKNGGSIIMDAIAKIRGEKARAGIPLSATLDRIKVVAPEKDIPILKENEYDVKQILRIREVEYEEGESLEIKL